MKFQVTDRNTIERGIVAKFPYVVISVRDPGTSLPRLKQATGLRGVLRLAFHDAEPTRTFRLPESVRLMTEGDARKIATFIRKHLSEIGLIVCHCEQGMSRSPAVACALAESLGESTERLLAGTQPNRYVHGLVAQAMKDVFGEIIPE